MNEFELIDIDYYKRIKKFDCNNLKINAYLKLSAYPDTIEFIASTSLVYKNEEVAAFFTINSDYFIEVIDPDTNEIKRINAIEIQYLGVDSSYKNQGVGREIVHYLIESCREMNNRFIFLQSVKDSVGFYEKMGFEIVESNDYSYSMILDLLDPIIVNSYYEQ